ncbi:MAG: UDP-glucose dehydrogenase family protein [Planctomycetota bacterium]|jgi:UDPglucose 6-dehydrogenase
MKIGVIGAGYVGLVAGTCFAEMGNHVHIVDVNEKVIDTLNDGRIHYYEPGLEELVKKNKADSRLKFSTDVNKMVNESKAIFLAVGTPQSDDGSADLSYIMKAAENVAEAMDGYKALITKSTVPVGTNQKIHQLVESITDHEFDIISNPEFLKEGAAIDDFMRPDRVVVGVRNEKAKRLMEDLYSPFVRTGHPIMVMDPESAEMTKYVSNAILASRISFMNEMANICSAVGADIDLVRVGVGSDRRIGQSFLFPGLGYGGSCFPKDVRALQRVAESVNLEARMCEAIDFVNVDQRLALIPSLESEYGRELNGITLSLWGIAFKPKTDDVREAPAVYLANYLMDKGAKIKAYDPEAHETALLSKGMERAEILDNPYKALDDSDGLIIATEWNEFRSPDFELIKNKLTRAVIFDGRNIFNPQTLKDFGFRYYSIGRPTVK